jgi:hypothetical protein
MTVGKEEEEEKEGLLVKSEPFKGEKIIRKKKNFLSSTQKLAR